MSSQPLVSCLTATHGRFSVLREALACYCAQDYTRRELLILNNSDVPLKIDPALAKREHIRLFNEPGHPTLGDCRMRLLELALGDVVRTWDDDDLYLPWAISQGVQHIGDAPAFKPRRSWDCRKHTWFTLCENTYEASMTVRAEVAYKYGYKAGGGDEHVPLLQGIEQEGGCKIEDVEPSYIYTWDTGLWHISGSLGSGDDETRTKEWLTQNTDTGDGTLLTPADLHKRWYELVAGAWVSEGEKYARALAERLRVEI